MQFLFDSQIFVEHNLLLRMWAWPRSAPRKSPGRIRPILAFGRFALLSPTQKNGGFVTFYIVGTVKKVKTLKKVGTVKKMGTVKKVMAVKTVMEVKKVGTVKKVVTVKKVMTVEKVVVIR